MILEWDDADDDPKQPGIIVRASASHSLSTRISQEEEEEEEEDASFAWTLRKASASALDSIANIVSPSVLVSVLLPLMGHMIDGQQQWLHLEAGILRIGCHSSWML